MKLFQLGLFAVFPGPVALSTACKLVSPGAVVSGTLSITKTELYFEMDEEENKDLGLDSKVGDHGYSFLTACSNGITDAVHLSS